MKKITLSPSQMLPAHYPLTTILYTGQRQILWHYYKENLGNESALFLRFAISALSIKQLANETTHRVNLPYRSTDLDLFR